MKTALNTCIIIGILCFFAPSCAQAQNAQGIRLGDTVLARTPVCLSKESAMAVAEIDHQQGVPAAVELINETADCSFGTLNVKLVKVVAQFSTARGAELKVVEVLVEMADDTWKPAWVLTDVPIQGAFST